MTTTLTFTIDLKGEARLQWKKFDDQVKTLARQCCTSLTGGTGILDYMLPVALWNTFPPNIRPDGTITPIFDIITAIADPAGGAPAGTVKIWDTRVSERKEILAAIEVFTSAFIAALPPSDISELSNPEWGMASVTLSQMYAHCCTKYSVLNLADFTTLASCLALPKSTAEDFPALAERHRDIHNIFHTASQPMSELNKCQHYIEALRSNPAGCAAIHGYKQGTPLIEHQTFAAIATYVNLHAPNYEPTTSSLGYSSALAAQVSLPLSGLGFVPPLASASLARDATTVSNSSDTDALKRQISQLQRELSQLTSTHDRQSRPTTPLSKSYCHFHGYCGHKGSDCTVMLRDPTTYSAAKLAAVDPRNPLEAKK